MYQYNPLHCLASSAELPDSDDKPVDSELQILIPIYEEIDRERHSYRGREIDSFD